MNRQVLNPKQHIATAKQWKTRRDERPKEHSLSFGEQDPMDIISYAGLEEDISYIVIDDQFIRSLFISGYPFVASSGWLNSLINFNHNADISYHVSSVDATQALPKLVYYPLALYLCRGYTNKTGMEDVRPKLGSPGFSGHLLVQTVASVTYSTNHQY